MVKIYCFSKAVFHPRCGFFMPTLEKMITNSMGKFPFKKGCFSRVRKGGFTVVKFEDL